MSCLKRVRGFTVDAYTEEGADDGRLYVQIIGVAGFPVFTVGKHGGYELPYEHTYKVEDMKKGRWSLVDGEDAPFNAVLFADQLAAIPSATPKSHTLCTPDPRYDVQAIERVRRKASDGAPKESWQIWREAA